MNQIVGSIGTPRLGPALGPGARRGALLFISGRIVRICYQRQQNLLALKREYTCQHYFQRSLALVKIETSTAQAYLPPWQSWLPFQNHQHPGEKGRIRDKKGKILANMGSWTSVAPGHWTHWHMNRDAPMESRRLL